MASPAATSTTFPSFPTGATTRGGLFSPSFPPSSSSTNSKGSNGDDKNKKPIENPLLSLRSPFASGGRSFSTSSTSSNISNIHQPPTPPPMGVLSPTSTNCNAMNGTAAATTTAFGDGFGIRQRRGRDDSVGAKTLSSDQQQESSYNSSASAMHRPPPPKVSFSLGTADMTTIAGATGGMGVDDIDSANTMANDGKENSKPSPWNRSSTAPPSEGLMTLPPSTTATTGCWVLVYGYSSASHYARLMRQFEQYGHILQNRGSCRPGVSNWFALQYSNQLEAEKALSQKHFQLDAGIFCGVKRLDETDPLLLQTQNIGVSDLWTASSATSSSTTATVDATSSPSVNTVGTNYNESRSNGASSATGAGGRGGLQEEDILLFDDDSNHRPQRSICERLLRLLLSVDNEEY